MTTADTAIYSIKDSEPKPFGIFTLKFLKTWGKCPISLVHEVMPKHSQVPYVSHDKTDELVYILSGGAIVDLDGKQTKVTQGDYFIIPSGTKHRFETKNKQMEALSIFSPPMNYDVPDTNLGSKKMFKNWKPKKSIRI
jgi:glyoxylate utilization-related uncharacterized protein